MGGLGFSSETDCLFLDDSDSLFSFIGEIRLSRLRFHRRRRRCRQHQHQSIEFYTQPACVAFNSSLSHILRTLGLGYVTFLKIGKTHKKKKIEEHNRKKKHVTKLNEYFTNTYS